MVKTGKYFEFNKQVWDFYGKNKRDFVWRQAPYDPYKILVSEIMLQQTQVGRVQDKFVKFIDRFPTVTDLAQAAFGEVLLYWHGLGYNRRALSIHASSKKIVQEFHGIVPSDPVLLQRFPGIGTNTASSICAFSFNKPVVFVETNIRAVYIHTFFSESNIVSDKELLPLIEETLDRTNPREWYYALMDYGVLIKKLFKNPSRKSKHYTTQSRFEGSERQIRGMILRLLLEHGRLTGDDLFLLIPREEKRIEQNLYALCDEGFVLKHLNHFMLLA